MPARPPIQVTREREQEAWRLRQRFWTEQRIADHLGIDQTTVSKMLDRVERDLAVKFEAEALPIKARQTAQLQEIANEAFAAWERSKEDGEKETVITGRIKWTDEGGAIPLPDQVTRSVEGQSGNPALLEKAINALAEIRKIWGWDAPAKADVTSGGEPFKVYGFDISEV
ncbi:MAG TPA: hypothetical protein VGP44_11695 [Gemmatimonadales bacterium]|nr:hypothetical protein [Gemmatimonadales bacterium]